MMESSRGGFFSTVCSIFSFLLISSIAVMQKHITIVNIITIIIIKNSACKSATAM